MTNQELRDLTAEALRVAEVAFENGSNRSATPESVATIAAALLKISSEHDYIAEALENT